MKRARGRAYPCACGEEKLRAPKGGLGRIDGWSYLFGQCGGGVKLRFEGIKVVEVKEVSKEEADRIRSLPAVRKEPYEAMLETLDGKDRERLDEIVEEIRQALEEGMVKWVGVGRLIWEAKRLLKKGDFGLWVERNGMDRHNAQRFIAVYEMVKATPAFSSTLRKIGHLKATLLVRLPEAKRLEVLQEGVPVNGHPKPLTEVTFRELHAYVRSVMGKDPRGRKPTRPPSFPFTPQQALFDALDKVLAGLRRLKREDLEGLTDAQRERAQDRWLPIFEVVQEVHEALRMDERLPVHIKGRK